MYRWSTSTQTQTTTVPITYYPTYETAPLPQPPIVKQDLSSNSYHVYKYTHFITFINVALEVAFKRLCGDLISIYGINPLASTTNPFLDFDPQTNRLFLYAEFYNYDIAYSEITNTEIIEIYFNERLYDLCLGLPFKRVSKTGDLSYKLIVSNNRTNLVPKYVPMNISSIVEGVTIITGFELRKFDFVMIQQEISSIALWNPVASIFSRHLSCPFKQRRRLCRRTWATTTTTSRAAGTTPTCCLQSRILL